MAGKDDEDDPETAAKRNNPPDLRGMSEPKQELPYRPCVGILMFNDEGRVFVGKRVDIPEPAWQMPQGGIGEGEPPDEAALRELEEEIGTGNVELMAETQDWISYDLPDALAGKVWKGRYRGQTQKWFAARFLGADTEIDVLGVAHPEFDDWRWVELDELPSLIVPFKRKAYELVVAEFRGIVVKSN